LNVNEKFVQYYDDCPKFINSLYFDWQKSILGDYTNTNNTKKWQTINYLSILIFQAWEDFLTSSKIDETGEIVWLNNFLQWLNSRILRDNWSVLKTNFAPTTQEFGNYLFYVSSMYVPKNEGELNSLASMAISSERFKNIIYNRFN